MRDRWLVVVLLVSVLMLVGGLGHHPAAQELQALDSTTIAANQELDRQFLEAHERKDVDRILRLFSPSPDTFFISPDGKVHKGLDAIRTSYVPFFERLQSIHGAIKEVSYLPAPGGVMAVGTAMFSRQPKTGPPEERMVVWMDFRRKEGGRWVYWFRHAHWPVQSAK